MPAGDGTGPGGLGPMTGRAAGYCAGYAVPGYTNPGYGFGYGGAWGRGGGRGWRNRYFATGVPGWGRGAAVAMPAPTSFAPVYGAPAGAPVMTREQQTTSLKAQAEYFEDALQDIRQRIKELEEKDRAD